MPAGNSWRDPTMREAATELGRLLSNVADAAEVARQEWRREPRWCGFPGADSCKRKYVQSRDLHALVPDLSSIPCVTDRTDALAYHELLMQAFIDLFRDGIARRSLVWSDGKQCYVRDETQSETPRHYLDRIRGELRYAHRLDDVNMTTVAFATLTCVKSGRPREVLGPLPGQPGMDQKYAYVPITQIERAMLPGVQAVSAAIQAAFDHCVLGLLPKRLTPQYREFIEWIMSVGGRCRQFELIEWIKKDRSRGLADDGQGTERKLLRMFCEKAGPAGSHSDWTIRPQAVALLSVP